MKIIRLKINNILNLRAIDIRPDKNVNKVSGKNAAGKTNLLETIRFSLLGKRAMPLKPLRTGTKKGDIKIDIGDYVVEVKITKNGEYWNVTDKAGKPVSKPMDLLKKIVGPISFDPLALLDDDPKKLKAVLLELVGVDLDTFDAKVKKLRDERTIAGRTLKTTKALLEACTWHDDAPEKEVSVSELADEFEKASNQNVKIEATGDDIDQLQLDIHNCLEKVQELNRNLEDKKKYLRENAIIDTAAMRDKIHKSDEINKQVRDNAEYTLREKAVDKESDEYEDFTHRIESIEGDKDKALSAAKMPIDGLSVDEDGVTYTDEKNGTNPMAQVNKAKRIEIGTAIHMAMNPELKVMFVDANSFDEETEAAIEKAVKDADYQLFEEVVDSESETGIMLVDGTVKEK